MSAAKAFATNENVINLPSRIVEDAPYTPPAIPSSSIKPSSNSPIHASTHSNLTDPIKSLEDIKKIKEYILTRPERYAGTNIRNYAFFCLGINCGRRVSDILRLHIADVLFSDGTFKDQVTLKEKKTSKTITFYLNNSVKAALYKYLSNFESVNLNDFLFPSRTKTKEGKQKPINRGQAWAIMNEIEKALELNYNLGTHSLRKTFGYHIATSSDDPMTLYTLQEIYGHSSPKITLRYVGIRKEEVEKLYEDLCL